MKYVYPAIFEDDDGKIGVTVPDIPHCHTFGDNMADAIEMAKDCIEMMLASYEDDGKAIPPASKINKIKPKGLPSISAKRCRMPSVKNSASHGKSPDLFS